MRKENTYFQIAYEPIQVLFKFIFLIHDNLVFIYFQ
jgi:hypothetical protein